MGFLQALSFLTIVRCGGGQICEEKETAEWGRYFFIVGLLIGAATAGLDYVLLKKFGAFFTSATCVMFIAVITGGLHLDGAADTFDAAFSMKSVAEKLAIMKRSDIGAFGAIAITFIIIMKIALLAEISGADRFKAIMLFPAISRGSLLAPSCLFNYPRESGKGAGFVKNMTWQIVIFGAVVALIGSFLVMRLKGVLLAMLAAMFSALAARFFNSKFNGVTGDVLGCVNELTEIFTLLCVTLLT